MKQKNGGIKRLLEFTGEKRSLLNISRILSGVSAIFILGTIPLRLFCST